MSGGHFDYKNAYLDDIAVRIQFIIDRNDCIEKDEWGQDIGRHYPPEIIEKLQQTVDVLRQCSNMVHRIDFLLSGDDGPESFLKYWENEVGPIV